MAVAISLTIGGIDRTDKTFADSVSIRRSLNERSTMTCELVETEASYRPDIGQQIYVEGHRAAFSGYIEDIEEQATPGNANVIKYRLTCSDLTRILDWRLYAGSFDAGASFYDVVAAIWAAKLQGDGITLGNVAAGPVLTARMQDGMRPVVEWFRKMATDFDYVFRINEFRQLDFGPLATSPPNPAPFSITFGSRNWRDLKTKRSMGDYRNRQYVRTEYTTSGELTKSFTGDASTRDFFQFDGPFSGAPVVTIDAVPVVVGIFGIDSPGSTGVLYDFEGWGLHFVSPQSAPGSGAVIEATYRVRFNNSLMLQDDAGIAARAAIQGDSGLIEAISEDRYIDTAAGLQVRAESLLRQYGTIPINLEFETDAVIEINSDDLDPGMLLDVDLTDGPSDVSDFFMVTSIDSKWTAAARDDFFVHQVTATNQSAYGHRVITPIEKISELLRIGPDVGTLLTSDESPVEVTPAYY